MSFCFIRTSFYSICFCYVYYLLGKLVDLYLSPSNKSIICYRFVYYNVKSQQLKSDMDTFIKKSRRPNPHSTGIFKIEHAAESDDTELSNSTTSLDRNKWRMAFDQKSLLNLKPTLTDSYLVDDELHKVFPLSLTLFVDF